MNNLLSYCGLVDAKIRASDKDLPVITLAFPNFQVSFVIQTIVNDSTDALTGATMV